MINLNYIFHSSCQFPISTTSASKSTSTLTMENNTFNCNLLSENCDLLLFIPIRLTGSIMTQIYVKLILFSLSLLNACCPLIESLCESDAHTTASPEKKLKWNCSEWGEPTKTIFQVPLSGTCIRKIFIQFKLEHRRWLGDHQEEKREEEQELEWRNWNLFELHKTFLHSAGGREKTTA